MTMIYLRPYRYRIFGAAAVMICAAAISPALAAECWQGWGYLVEPKSLAFKSEQKLFVTDGRINWNSRAWIKLHPVDPKTGRRVPNGKTVLIRPSRPARKGGENWGQVVEDVAEVHGSKWSMMLRLTHIKPSPHSRTLNDSFSRWACGFE